MFYEKLVGYLEAYGFNVNPYDPCVANKMIGGKQLTVFWHANNLKISCIDANEVTKMIQWLESEYGEMHGSRGKRHDYLEMWLDYSIPGELRIYMEEYLRGVLDYFLEEITETPETPAASNLFTVRDDSDRDLPDETRAQSFHHAVAKLLFTGIRCTQDAQTAIYFPTTRVRKADVDDWKKLRRLLGYLKRTIKLPLILRADGVTVLKWWVDTSYAANDNIRGHT